MKADLQKLRELEKEHGVRASTLIPDLAFVGLIKDVIDAVDTATELLDSAHPYRAYALARVAVEATQRLLIIATADNYVNIGTRAWLYYRMKDNTLADKSAAALGETERQILETWGKYLPSANQLIQDLQSEIQTQKKKPDNFLGRGLANEVTRAYDIIAKEKGGSVPANATEINQSFYSSLCREAHACLRLEPASFAIDADGFINVVEQERPIEQIKIAVCGALKITLSESIEAVRYRLQVRRRENASKLETAIIGRKPPTSSECADDLGCMLLQKGFGQANAVFPSIPFLHFNELPDKTISATLQCGFGDEKRAGTFDFKGPLREELLSLIEHRFPGSAKQINGLLKIDLPRPLPITITAVLGSIQETENETFIPLIVTKMKEWNETGNLEPSDNKPD